MRHRTSFFGFLGALTMTTLAALLIAGPASQTISAASGAAQAATATAVSTPPVSADTLQVDQIIEFPLLAAPGRTSAYLAPGGDRIAYLSGPQLCILSIDPLAAYIQSAVDAGAAFDYSLDGLTDTPERFPGVACVSLEMISGLDPETIRWSPDGRYLAMAENFFQRLNDSDIWVLDTQTMTLADITDDGAAKFSLTGPADEALNVDVLPRWMADGRLVFVRYTGQSAGFVPPYIYTIRPDGSDLQQAGQIATTQKLAVSALAVTAQGKLAYTLWAGDNDTSGIWISDLDGSHPQQVWHNADNPSQVPSALDWSPDGQVVAFTIFPKNNNFQREMSYWRAVRVSDGQAMFFSPDYFVWSAGWSPDSRAVIYTVRNPLDPSIEGLYISAGPGAPGRMLVPAQKNPDQLSTGLISTTSLQEQSIPWTVGNTVMVGRGATAGILIIRLAAP